MKWKIGTSLVVGVAVVSVGLSLFVTGYWSTESSESSGAVAAVSESEGDGLHEGIGIDGDWEIKVRDPDGTLVARRVFSNAMTNGGKSKMRNAMNGDQSAFSGAWAVALQGSPGPCEASQCWLNMGNATPTEYTNNQAVLTKSSTGVNVLRLSGTYLAGVPAGGSVTEGTITAVQTYIGGSLFSQKAITPVPFSKGQLIEVLVEFVIN